MRKILLVVFLVLEAGCTTSQNAASVSQKVASSSTSHQADQNKSALSPASKGVCDQPKYPFESMLNGEEGKTRIMFTIGADGLVLDEKIEISSGYARLDQAATAALASCKFNPATLDGVAQKSMTSVDFVWKLPPNPVSLPGIPPANKAN